MFQPPDGSSVLDGVPRLDQVNVLLRQEGLIEVDGDGQVTKRRVWAHSNGGACLVCVSTSREASG